MHPAVTGVAAEDPREALLRLFLQDRHVAHKALFPHRHRDETPAFHHEVIDLWNSPAPKGLVVAFRGAAKSTLAEEHIIIGACLGEFKYAVIVGNSYPRACERLAAIKHELEGNEAIIALFGGMIGPTWSENEIVLSNGVKVQAFGARQSLRGAKHHEARPDLVLVDDIEDEDLVATEEARRKLMRWLVSSLIPAMDPHGKLRMIGTPLHPKGAVETFKADQGWHAKVFPIRYVDPATGDVVATWPARFPLTWIEAQEQAYAAAGNSIEFAQEYLCVAEDAATKPFQAKVMPAAYTPAPYAHLPTWVFVDPARTVNQKTSARTGYAAWSWIGNRLLVRKAFGAFHQPDEIIKTIFELDAEFHPVSIGVELDGLEEFINQPLRAAMVERGHPVPLKGVRAPKGKDQFIMSLQPFFQAGDVMFERPVPDLVSELLQFPSGRKDVPNALAYSLRMRAGRPVYEDFSPAHVEESVLSLRQPRYLLVSSRAQRTAGVLVQFFDGRLRIFGDWVREGAPVEALEPLVQQATMAAGGNIRIAAPLEQFDKWTGHGVPAAARKLGLEVQRLGPCAAAQGGLATWLRKTVGGTPSIRCSPEARWCLNGLAGGYARALTGSGTLAEQPADDEYKLVLEALEAFMSWFNLGISTGDEDSNRRYATASDGRQYLTSLAR